MSQAKKVVPSIIHNCKKCLFYRDGRCYFMYIQNIDTGTVYFEKAEILRSNNKQCGESAKWYIGNERIRIEDIYSKKHCYDDVNGHGVDVRGFNTNDNDKNEGDKK